MSNDAPGGLFDPRDLPSRPALSRRGPCLKTTFARRLIEAGWRPPSGALSEDRLGMYDSFGVRIAPPSAREPGSHCRTVNESVANVMHSLRKTAPVEMIHFDRHRVQVIEACGPAESTCDAPGLRPAIGSCAFTLARHGDLRIEWEEKDNAEIIKLIADKMAEGWRFFEIDYTGKVLPIERRGPTGKSVIVHDDAIKGMMEAGFARFPTTRFEGMSSPVRRVESAEEAARCQMIAMPPLADSQSAPVAPDVLVGDQRIMECLNAEGMQHLTGEGEFTLKRTQLWVERGHLPVASPNGKHGRRLVTRQVLVDWFTDINAHRDPLDRLPPSLRAIILERRERARETRLRQKIREAQSAD